MSRSATDQPRTWRWALEVEALALTLYVSALVAVALAVRPVLGWSGYLEGSIILLVSMLSIFGFRVSEWATWRVYMLVEGDAHD